jgi:hypothetical protein
MKIRSLIAATVGVSLLTLAIAIPVSAGGPATFKVGQRGVSFGVTTMATNCTMDQTTLTAAKKIGAAGKITGQQLPDYPCLLDKGTAAKPAIENKSYYIVWAGTTGQTMGQAGSGYWWTGFGSWVPETYVEWVAWTWNGIGWWMSEGLGDYFDADVLSLSGDLGEGYSSTYIPGLGTLDVSCRGFGTFGRDAATWTAGLDPDNGWTYEFSTKTRLCDPVGTTLNGTALPFGLGELDRTLFTQVLVFPY